MEALLNPIYWVIKVRHSLMDMGLNFPKIKNKQKERRGVRIELYKDIKIKSFYLIL